MANQTLTMPGSLALHIKARAPLVWVVSDEPRRVAEHVINLVDGDRPIVRLDLLNGLEQWDSAKGWRIVLIDGVDDEGNAIKLRIDGAGTQALWPEIFKYIRGNSGILLWENAHLLTEMMTNLLSHTARKWLEAYFDDDAERLGPTLVMISCNEKIPPEVARNAVMVHFDLPNSEVLGAIVDHVVAGTGLDVDDNAGAALVRAGLGLSEFEFVHAFNSQLTERGQVEADAIQAIKLARLRQDGILEVRQPRLTINDVGGLDLAKDLLGYNAWLWSHPREAAELEVAPLNRIVLIGLSGSGKSALCEAAAHSLGLELIKFGVGRAMNMFVGESEHRMRKAFEQIRVMAPVVLWTDELGRDLSGGQSSGYTDGGTTDRVHGELLSGLQDLPPNVFWVAASNSIEGLPPEMLRADRVDKILFVGFPTDDERQQIFTIHLGSRAPEFDLERLAQSTEYFTGAEIKTLIAETRFIVAGREHRTITTEDLMAAIPEVKNRVWLTHRDLIKEMYAKAITDWSWASSLQLAWAKAKWAKNSGAKTNGGGAIAPIADVGLDDAPRSATANPFRQAIRP